MQPKKVVMLILSLVLLSAVGINAQVALPPSGFDMTGYIQEATLDGTVAGTAAAPLADTDPRAGGTLTINSIKMLVPNNSIVQMPAASFSWAQLFDPAVSASIPAGRPNHVAGQTGLAIVDTYRILPAVEVRVVGNVSPDPVTGAPRYIVGLILPVSQELLNAASGVINYINYPNGWFRVGGVLNDPNSGTMVQINDPVGRFGKVHSRDPRFTADTQNPTVTATTGYPVGIPRVAPPGIDSLCPLTNRPLNNPASVDPNQPFDPFLAAGAPLKTFTMPAPGGPAGSPDPRKQVPLMVGDWVNCQGTLFKQNPAGNNNAVNWFLHAHTLVANLGVYTQPGVQPCYLRIEKFEIGTDGSIHPAVVPTEFATRLQVVGFTTDTGLTATLTANAIDVDPVTGAETLIPIPSGTAVVDQLPLGRFRMQLSKIGPLAKPPTAALPTPTREYVVTHSTGITPNVANGLTGGQFRLPCFGYAFPEALAFGAPTVANNFNDFKFLAVGDGPLNGTGPVLGRLDPWPGP